MTEQPRTVVCTSCNAKFHVPEELVRGKHVKFRCRKCGSAIDVDGRRSARAPAAPPPPPPPPVHEVTAVDTPATFSQRTLPPPRPPVGLTKSSPNLHPWPEPPRTTSTPPIAISNSIAPEESSARVEASRDRDPSNRAPKIAAIVSLLIAAGLSGFGLAMRSAPNGPNANGGQPLNREHASSPADPQSQVARAHGAEAKVDEAIRANRNPTRVTDLPVAVDGVETTAATGAGATKPSEAVVEKQEQPHQATNAASQPAALNAGIPNAVPAGNAGGEPAAPSTGTTEPGTAPPAQAAANGSGATANAAAVPAGAAPAAVMPPSAGPSPAPAARSKGDFNTQAAREAMEDAAGRAGKCRNIDTPSGTARVAVTFASNGHVTNAVIESGPFVGTAAGNCVASKFRSAKVPPFSGESVTVRKSVPF